MKRPLLGIIAVICLQMLFTAFNAIDRSGETLFAVNELARGTNAVALISEETRDLRLVDRIINQSEKRNTSSSAFLRKSTVAKDSSSAYDKKISGFATIGKQSRTQDLVAMERPFESTVITYPRYVRATVAEPDNDPRPTRPAVMSEKRSFLSKSASILKKPYTWIKALGAKLN